ncbi:MAG: hypothetical protein ACK4E2_03225 [Pseudothermotoga sp.]
MKKTVVLVLGLVLVAVFSLAGVFNKGYGNMRQINKQLTYIELIKALDLSRDQAEQLLNVIVETKEQLNALEKEYEVLLEKSKDMTLNELSTQRRALNQKRAEILQGAEKKIAEILKVSQLENLRNYYFSKARDCSNQFQQRQKFQQTPAKPFDRTNKMAGRFDQIRQRMMSKSFAQTPNTGFRFQILLGDYFEEVLRSYLQ